jgi:porin
MTTASASASRAAPAFIVPFELGYGTDYDHARCPRHVILGGWVDRGDYSDPLRDTSGGIAA